MIVLNETGKDACKALSQFNDFIGRKGSLRLHHILTDNFYFPQHSDGFAFKFCLAGEVTYFFEGQHFTLRPGQFLVLKEDQAHAGFIRSSGLTSALSLYIPRPLLQSLFAPVCGNQEPFAGDAFCGEDLLIPENAFVLSPAMAGCVSRLRQCLYEPYTKPALIFEAVHRLLQQFVQLYRKRVSQEMDRIELVKASTRMEIFKRIMHARIFIEKNYQKNISIRNIARNACMSENHFLRFFKAVLHITPHQLIIARRIGKARELLLRTELQVNDIVAAVGFQDASSFIRLFKSYHSVSPRQFRLMNQSSFSSYGAQSV